MTPTEKKFRIGQRVRLSATGKELLLPWSKKMKATTRGTVKAHFSTLGVIVHVDGYSRSASYHMNFWEPLSNRASTATGGK